MPKKKIEYKTDDNGEIVKEDMEKKIDEMRLFPP